MDWLSALDHCRRANTACVVVMVLRAQGSVPRVAGTRMLITADRFFGTVGGGALELAAITRAREILANAQREPAVQSQTLNLAKALSQCCGGQVELQFDLHMANDWPIHIFGAGHVALELARLLVRIPCHACFYDQRGEWLNRIIQVASKNTSNTFDDERGECGEHWSEAHVFATGHVTTQLMDENIPAIVESLSPRAYYLVMTHSHDLDYEVVEAVLTRGDAQYCGLIASKSKAARFRQQLKRRGFTTEEMAHLTAPLGHAIKTGNTPMEIALAAMSDILNLRY